VRNWRKTVNSHPIWDDSIRRSRPTRVLVVDDDAGLRDMLDRHLRMTDYDVRQADNGVAALEVCATWAPDVALVDFVMPKMGGLELLERLHEQQPLTRVLMMTGLASPEKAIESLRLGATACMIKPIIDLDRLDELIGMALEHAKLWRSVLSGMEDRASCERLTLESRGEQPSVEDGDSAQRWRRIG